jgi:hypothetical protein
VGEVSAHRYLPPIPFLNVYNCFYEMIKIFFFSLHLHELGYSIGKLYALISRRLSQTVVSLIYVMMGDTECPDGVCVIALSLHTNSRLMPQIRPWLLPYTYFPILYSLLSYHLESYCLSRRLNQWHSLISEVQQDVTPQQYSQGY